jgi:hypothetical protein
MSRYLPATITHTQTGRQLRRFARPEGLRSGFRSCASAARGDLNDLHWRLRGINQTEGNVFFFLLVENARVFGFRVRSKTLDRLRSLPGHQGAGEGSTGARRAHKNVQADPQLWIQHSVTSLSSQIREAHNAVPRHITKSAGCQDPE